MMTSWHSTDGVEWREEKSTNGRLKKIFSICSYSRTQELFLWCQSDDRNILLASREGREWKPIKTPFYPESVRLLEFDNALWAFMDYSMWTSDDGREWHLRNAGEEISKDAIVLGDRIVMEMDGARTGLTKNGIEWFFPEQNVTISFKPNNEGFYKPPYHTVHWQIFELDHTIFLIGETSNEVFKSVDGTHWDKIIPQAGSGFISRSGAAVTTPAGRIWIIGGEWFGGQGENVESWFHLRLNNVWSSRDGAAWEQTNEDVPWMPRAFMNVADFHDRLVMIGGEVDPHDALWSTTNGVDWQAGPEDESLAIAGAMHPTLEYFSLIEFNGLLWLIPQQEWIETMASSRDGKHWVLHKRPSPRPNLINPIQVSDPGGNPVVIAWDGNGLLMSHDMFSWIPLSSDCGEILSKNTNLTNNCFRFNNDLYLFQVDEVQHTVTSSIIMINWPEPRP